MRCACLFLKVQSKKYTPQNHKPTNPGTLYKIKPNLQKIDSGDQNAINTLKESLNLLGQIDIHYKKKENLFFPYMEKYGITAPPKVMWGVDDEIRALLKKSKLKLLLIRHRQREQSSKPLPKF